MSTTTTTSAGGYVDPFMTSITYCQQVLSSIQQPDDKVDQDSSSSSNNDQIKKKKKQMIIELNQQMVNMIQSKLWHQLTHTILQYLLLLLQQQHDDDDENVVEKGSIDLYMFYTNVIQIIHAYIHPMALARMTVLITQIQLIQQSSNNNNTSASTSTSSSSMELLQQTYTLLKDQQQKAYIANTGNSSNTTGRSNTNNSSSSTATPTTTINYGTPTSYVEAILYIECYQSIYTIQQHAVSMNNNNNNNKKITKIMKRLLQPIYNKVIKPNATIIQDLISLTTTGANVAVVDTLVPTTTDTTTTTSTLETTTTKMMNIQNQYISSQVYSAYYEMTVLYDSYVHPYTATYYHHALLYLQYSNTIHNTTSTVWNVVQEKMANDLCWSAIFGDGIYNLSYIVEHPFIVQQLGNNNNNKSLVYELLSIISNPSIMNQYVLYQEIMSRSTMKQTLDSISNMIGTISSSSSDALYQYIHEKYLLITLLHIITTTTTSSSSSNTTTDMEMDGGEQKTSKMDSSTSDRCFTFDDLKLALHLPTETMDTTTTTNIIMYNMDLELLLMRALSIGLIKGMIDEVSQTITITYIQPSPTLTMKQYQLLLQQYNTFTTTIQQQCNTLLSLQQQTTQQQ